MDWGEDVLEVRCDEPEGSIVRTVRRPALTTERLKSYYDRLKKFEIIFNDESPNDPVSFAQIFLAGDLQNGVRSKGIIFEVDDVGILWLTYLGEHRAMVHFSFWDRRLRGREKLLRKMVRYAFQHYGLERVEVQVGLYAKPVLYAVERVGFKREGRLRNTVRFKGEWYDSIMYSIIREDLENEAAVDSARERANAVHD